MGANALVVLNRIAFFDRNRGQLELTGQRAILNWAAHSGLGQDPTLTAQVAARRRHALTQLGARGQAVARLRAVPQWRLIMGLGERANAHEIGLMLHGSYGWPIMRGSSVKGLAAAWAATTGASDDRLRAVFGAPRPRHPATATATANDDDDTLAGGTMDGTVGGGVGAAGAAAPAVGCGGVRFLDAIPLDPVRVVVDVLNPHVKPYYDDTTHQVPPAEYHNPVPVFFLTVTATFAVDLYGPDRDLVEQAADWVIAAGDELGAGAKTAAGYGYLTVTRGEGP
jgi:CRISPR-associated protein Cmr6